MAFISRENGDGLWEAIMSSLALTLFSFKLLGITVFSSTEATAEKPQILKEGTEFTLKKKKAETFGDGFQPQKIKLGFHKQAISDV